MWSEAARKAAAEARRRKHGSTTHVTVQSVRGKKVKVSRDLYAQKVRRARELNRQYMSSDLKKSTGGGAYTSGGIKYRNTIAKAQGGTFAAAEKRRSTKRPSRPRTRRGVMKQPYYD